MFNLVMVFNFLFYFFVFVDGFINNSNVKVLMTPQKLPIFLQHIIVVQLSSQKHHI